MRLHRRVLASLFSLGVALCLPGPMLHAIQLDKPKSVIELLINMKLATQSGFIEQDDFYVEDILRHAFGAGTVRFTGQRCLGNFSVNLSNFPAWVPRVETLGRPIDAFDFRMRKYERSDGKSGAWVSMAFRSKDAPRPSFDEIVQLFGRDWVECELPPPSSHPSIPPPVMHPRGNACIVYQLWSNTPQRKMIFKFSPNEYLFETIVASGFRDDPPWEAGKPRLPVMSIGV